MKITFNVSELWIIFCIGQPKRIKNTFQDTTFKVEENSRTFQATIEFKDFSMTPPKIQALFETMRTLVLEKKKEKGLLVRY